MGQSKVRSVLTDLASHGWISLRSMSVLLGYSHPTGIYGRQRGSNPIPVIRVGGVQRVYEEEVISALDNVREHDRDAAQTVLALYRQIKREQKEDIP